ncbi:Cupin domain protein [Roseovarius litoreus]|uniref:Cupin domain protein n=1 Tax=Roseovarius litoreus TaxID=1155722 RepID=A0A1M7FDR8_9RHOB|nr:cupin domain-containing protein [Roseovarius litoreus]SHM02113.1 Cupin domain protein [Roseovarius litoreus]
MVRTMTRALRGAPMLCLLALVAAPGLAKDAYPPVELLLQSETTVIGQPIVYPEGPGQITVAIVTMQSGQETGWHLHEAPMAAHVLEGELTVDYGPDGTRVYRKGDTLVEALGTRHQGRNTGAGLARVLVVFAGAEGTPNTVAE